MEFEHAHFDLEPTEKSSGIDALLTFISGVSRPHAIRAGVCTWCKASVDGFRDDLSRREYTISGLCQSCQDETFGNDDDE